MKKASKPPLSVFCFWGFNLQPITAALLNLPHNLHPLPIPVSKVLSRPPLHKQFIQHSSETSFDSLGVPERPRLLSQPEPALGNLSRAGTLLAGPKLQVRRQLYFHHRSLHASVKQVARLGVTLGYTKDGLGERVVESLDAAIASDLRAEGNLLLEILLPNEIGALVVNHDWLF
jgi:hypothetical protein